MVAQVLEDVSGETLTDLEMLRVALGSISGREQPWDMGMWNQCTCGHIYGAALNEGRLEPNEMLAIEGLHTNPTVARLLDYVIEAHQDDPDSSHHGDRHTRVSDLTFKKSHCPAGTPAKEYDEAQRKAAIKILQTTITWLEAKYTENMEKTHA